MDRQANINQYGQPHYSYYEGEPIYRTNAGTYYTQQPTRSNSIDIDSGIHCFHSRTTSFSETNQHEQGHIDLDMSRWDFYEKVQKIKLSSEVMKFNGYPMMDDQKNVVIQLTKYEKGKEIWASDQNRQCFRCNQIFSYADSSCGGLHVHVTSQMPVYVKNEFTETPLPHSKQDPRSNKVYAIDCEMIYTMNGLELARFTMTNFNGEVELDLYVKPVAEILDLNTQFSGITYKDLEMAKDTSETCRRKLFDFINSETILVGHSLESDLKALRLVHPNVVDTSLLFAGENGRKQGLRRLAERFLGATIQQPGAGHNSKEDAQTTYNLLKYFIKNH